VPKKEFIFDLDSLDLNKVVAGPEEIRRYNPQRFEMEHLSGIVFEDTERNACMGFKDVTDQEFWVRGHMPGMPLMPGVIMCEAAAQLCGYYTAKYKLLGDNVIVGFGGLEEVRFRDPVRPGCRLYLMTELTKLRPRAMVVSYFQGMVDGQLVVDGKIKGVPLPVDALMG
jgi:3-hydroxyacyl-[acyl-carrier-protein] dehydratase